MLRSPALRFVRPSYMPKYVPDANSVLWLPGQDDAYSSVIRDRSGYGNNGAITGATWKRTGQGLWYLDFDGADDVVNCGTGASLDITDVITIKAWVNPEGLGEGNNGKLLASTLETWTIFMNASTRLRMNVTDGAVAQQTVRTNANSVPLNAWTHAVFTYDEEIMKCFVAGVVQTATDSFDTGLQALGAEVLYVGDNGGSTRCWDGGIALLEIIHGAWTQAQVSNSYNQERHLFGV